MKKLFAVLLSLQLMMLPVAFAQSSGDQFRKGTPKNGGMDLYAAQILGLATSVIGSNILTSCHFGTTLLSLKLYMGGSLINIAKEIAGGKAQNENHKKRAGDLKMIVEKMKSTAGGDLQKETLEQALKEEKETLSFINKRKMWVMAVTAIYLAATAATFFEQALPNGGVAGCLGTPMTGMTAYALTAAYGMMAGKVGGGGAISTYGGMLLSLGTMVTGLGAKVVVAYNTPTARAITFGASTLLMGVITKGLMDRARITKENIGNLEKAIANFKANSQPGNGLATDNSGGAKLNPSDGKNFALNALSDGTKIPKECWSNTSKGMEYSTGACKSPVRLPGGGFNNSLNVPTLSSAAMMANDMSQKVANGDIEGAESTAAELSSMAGRLRDIKDNIAKQTNDKLVAQGKKPIDFDGESKKLASSMMADLNKAAGTSASLASNPGQGSAELNQETKETDENKINTTSAGAVIDVPSATGGVVTEGLVNDPSLAEIAAPEAPVDYEYNEQDVSEKQDVTLFQQVSNRYLFQYNKIFKRDEPKPEPVK